MMKVMFLVVQMKDSNGKDYWHAVPLINEITELHDAWLIGDFPSTVVPVYNEQTIKNLAKTAGPISKAELRHHFKKLKKLESFEELFK